ncbi:VWA domain-containing protein [Pseudorhodoferax sp. Leaf267]|uniref:VWA domain-containing protein n=1 Tax=Pseudorhodoferax sp. Leaf267 TaxID=1736316 RepID=UPI0006F58C09|nr:VWA domain-containing protein [Pseudorhodoferax sp. Leaf267]KQP11863.1 hypothetical protein ASF43_23200 [Pseudorhodoferax sp. Leaf267]
MPQRLLYTPRTAGFALEVHGRSLLASHEQIVNILRSRLGQAHGDLLASPKPDAEGVAWSTALSGDAVLASTLPPEERDKLDKRAQRLLNDIRGLGQQLAAEGSAAQMVGQMIERAAQLPSGDWLYSVGGKPVLVLWGHADAAQPPVPPVAPPAAAPAPAAAAAVPAAAAAAPDPAMDAAIKSLEPAAGTAAAAAAPSAAPPARRRWLWALLLLPLLAALLFFGLRGCQDQAAPADDLSARLGEAQARNKALEDEIARKKAQAPQFMCVRPSPEPPVAAASAPEPEASAPVAAASEPEPPVSQAEAPKADPYDALKKRVAGAGRNCADLQRLSKDALLRAKDPRAAPLRQDITEALKTHCSDNLIKEAKNMCPGQRPAELAPELALVFDASGSMGFSLNASDEEIRQLAQLDAMRGMMRQFGLGQAVPGIDINRVRREPTRMTAARQAALTMVRRAPSDANIGLVLVEDCPAARSAGFYPPGRRGELAGIVQGIQPRGGTPLADGIARAGRMVDGVKREALMVVVTDGRESCGRDPCAEAAALMRAKPHLKINVVDITGTGAGNCVAQIGRGRVFTARNADEVAAMTRQASQEAMGPANCSRP